MKKPEPPKPETEETRTDVVRRLVIARREKREAEEALKKDAKPIPHPES